MPNSHPSDLSAVSTSFQDIVWFLTWTCSTLVYVPSHYQQLGISYIPWLPTEFWTLWCFLSHLLWLWNPIWFVCSICLWLLLLLDIPPTSSWPSFDLYVLRATLFLGLITSLLHMLMACHHMFLLIVYQGILLHLHFSTSVYLQLCPLCFQLLQIFCIIIWRVLWLMISQRYILSKCTLKGFGLFLGSFRSLKFTSFFLNVSRID